LSQPAAGSATAMRFWHLHVKTSTGSLFWHRGLKQTRNAVYCKEAEMLDHFGKFFQNPWKFLHFLVRVDLLYLCGLHIQWL